MPSLFIVRHGQSVWNLENRFTGWADVELTPKGEEEARQAGQLLKAYPIDAAYTSVLKRAIHTLALICEVIDKPDLPITRNAALNERNYGDLQGLNKAETAQKYGADQVLTWRRSYAIRPPNGESLEDTYHRVIPYYQQTIEPQLTVGKNILIAAHGNSLRALMMYLEHISPAAIEHIDLPTGVPRHYQLAVSGTTLTVESCASLT